MNETYAITFGDRYARELHPVFGHEPTLAKGYGLVTADTEEAVGHLVHNTFGSAYSMLYRPEELERRYFPAGQLFLLTPNQDGQPVITRTPRKDTP